MQEQDYEDRLPDDEGEHVSPVEESHHDAPEDHDEPMEHHAEPEEPFDEDTGTAERNRQSNRISGKKRIGQLTREKYQLLDALRQANEEREALRQQSLYLNSNLGATQNAALTQHQHSIALKAESAKKAKIKAYEEGDIEGQVRADELLAEAKAEELQANTWKIQNDAEMKRSEERFQHHQQHYQQHQNFNQPHIDENLFHDWVDDNDWFNPGSQNYNKQAQHSVISYAKQLDNYLINNGRADKILSPEYFEELDAFSNREGYNQRRRLEMRNNRHDIAPVSRGGYGTTNRGKDRASYGLTDREKEMARSFGVSEKEYSKHKMLDIKRRKEEGRPY